MQHDLNGVGFMSELSPGVSVLKNVLPILRHAHPTQFCFGHWMDNPSEMVNGKFCGSPSRIQKCSLSTLGISRWDCRTNSDPNPGHSPSHRRHHQGLRSRHATGPASFGSAPAKSPRRARLARAQSPAKPARAAAGPSRHLPAPCATLVETTPPEKAVQLGLGAWTGRWAAGCDEHGNDSE